MPDPVQSMTDEELELANQSLMAERAAILGRQRDITAEIEARASAKRVAVLHRALAAELPPDVQVLDTASIESLATVLTPGQGAHQ